MAIRYTAVRAYTKQDATRPTQVTSRHRWRSALLLGVAALMIASTGCSWVKGARRYLQRTEYLDEFMIAHRNRALAAKAWYREQDCYCNERYLNEFKAGFLQGYADIANGADGCAPCVAPSQYWGWKYQSPGGQAAVDAWFAGYPIGVKAAEQDGVGHWGNVGAITTTHVAKPPEQLPTTPEGIEIQNGKLMGPDGPVDEMIVPGSTQIIPAEELQRALDAESLPPVPTETVPLPLDSAASPIRGQTTPVDQVAAPTPIDTALVPSRSAQSFTLNDLGDDAIEDIFGAIQMPSDVDNLPTDVTPTGTKAGELPGLDDAVETAKATSGIPFKLE
ncbi:MAG: hypothetical protein AAFU85_24060 [Planctomycetota bacterium]